MGFWELNVNGVLASTAIIVGALLEGRRRWSGHRAATLLRVKHVSHSWGGVPVASLDVEFEFRPRERFQVSYCELVLGGRHCHIDGFMPFTPSKGEKRSLTFVVPNDITRIPNTAYMTMQFAGSSFRSELFDVEAAG